MSAGLVDLRAVTATSEPIQSVSIRASVVPLTFSGLALVLCLASLPSIDPSQEGPLGLISVLSPGYMIGLALLGIGFIIGLTNNAQPSWVSGVQTVLLIVLVGGVTAMVEVNPSNPVTYTHLGFAQYMTSHGAIPPPIDARVAWPGMFAALGLIESFAGHGTAYTIARWAPLAFDLIWLPGLLLIARAIVNSRRAQWLAVWIFFLANWSNENYLSPQAMDMLFFVTLIGVVLNAFSTDLASRWQQRLPSWLTRGTRWTPTTPWSTGLTTNQRACLMGIILILCGAMAISHQLTPFLATLVLAGLVVLKRVRLPELPWILGIIAIAWLSLGATTFWSGHSSLLFGQVGDVAGNVTTTVTGRFQGGSAHLLVLMARVAISLVVLLLATVGFLRLRALERAQFWVPVVAVLPILTLVVQSYGGESSIRIYLFSLPFLAPLAASAVLPGVGLPPPMPNPNGDTALAVRITALRRSIHDFGHVVIRKHRKLGAILGCVGVGVATFSSVTAIYGGDAYEQTSTAELGALRWLYEAVPHGSTIVSTCINLPWRYQDITAYHYKTIPDGDYASLPAVIDPLLIGSSRKYVVLTTNQGTCGTQYDGLPAGWLNELEHNLISSRHATVVYQNSAARIYEIYNDRVAVWNPPAPDNNRLWTTSPGTPNAATDQTLARARPTISLPWWQLDRLHE